MLFGLMKNNDENRIKKDFTLLKQESRFTLGLNTAKKYALYQKMPQTKFVY